MLQNVGIATIYVLWRLRHNPTIFLTPRKWSSGAPKDKKRPAPGRNRGGAERVGKRRGRRSVRQELLPFRPDLGDEPIDEPGPEDADSDDE
jgi:hypothetical protein